MARVVKKGTCRHKILRALTILVWFKKNNGVYTEMEQIPKKIPLSDRPFEGGRVARLAEKGRDRYKKITVLPVQKWNTSITLCSIHVIRLFAEDS